MKSAFIVRLAVLSTLAAAVPATVRAQAKQIEVRLDAINISSQSNRFSLSAVVPGSAAVALYLTPNIAIESRATGLSYSQFEAVNGDDVSVTGFQAGVFLPIHFGSARGRKGFFVAPGLMISKSSVSGLSTSSESDWDTSYGLDLGYKKSLHDRVSLRSALTYRDGGPLVPTYGATVGVSLFFR